MLSALVWYVNHHSTVDVNNKGVKYSNVLILIKSKYLEIKFLDQTFNFVLEVDPFHLICQI